MPSKPGTLEKPPEPYDFRSTFAVVNVTAADTGRTVTFSAVKSVNADEHIPAFSNMTVKDSVSTHSEINVTLTPYSYQDTLNLLKSDWLKIGNTIGVRWGYTRHRTHSSDWHYGMLLQPDVSFGDQFSITLKASGFGFIMSRSHLGRVWSSFVDRRKGLYRSRKDIIEIIARKYNFDLFWNDSRKFPGSDEDPFSTNPFSGINLFSQEADAELTTKRKSIIQTANDFIFLKHLAVKSGCKLFISKGNQLHIHDLAYSRDPVATFIYRGAFDLNKNLFPVDTFDAETSALFLPMTGVANAVTPPNVKGSQKPTQLTSDDSKAPTPSISGKNAPKPTGPGPTVRSPGGREKIPRRPDVSAEPEGAPSYVPFVLRNAPGAKGEAVKKLAQSKLNGIFKQRADFQGATATVSGPDLPGLMPADLIRMKGVGDYYSVNYRVFEITRTIGEDFAVHETALRPKGFPPVMAKWVEEKAKVVKDQPPSAATTTTWHSGDGLRQRGAPR